MLVFQDLVVLGSRDELVATLDAVKSHGSEEWSRNQQAERRMQDVGTPTVTFDHASPTHPASSVFLGWADGGSTLRVFNIVPSQSGQIEIAVYNSILRQFADDVVRPAAQKAHAKVVLSSDQQSPRDWFGDAAGRALEGFSEFANKSSGVGHPMDRRRFNEFVILAHKHEGDSFATDWMERWLIEEKRWPEDMASRLVLYYEFGRLLLQQYDNDEQ